MEDFKSGILELKKQMNFLNVANRFKFIHFKSGYPMYKKILNRVKGKT